MSSTPEFPEVDPRYPIGNFSKPDTVTPHERMAAIAAIAEMPSKLREAVDDLDRAQLDTPYREGGWTVRQLVHHVADSHMNAFLRLRLLSPRIGPPSPHTTKKHGPSSRTRPEPPWIGPSTSSKTFTPAGS